MSELLRHAWPEAAWRWENSYATLPALFYEKCFPQAVVEPDLVVLNTILAEEMGLNAAELVTPRASAFWAGSWVPAECAPLAQAYAGHQFGHFTGLGDGRALLVGEHRRPDGRLVDVQWKGAGRTPYSRRGDGRAALGPMLREYLISEAMHALGIPTTRSLAVALTGQAVQRDEVLPGAVLTRIASSHLRIGTVQWAAAHQDTPSLRALLDYAMARHEPDLLALGEKAYLAWFDRVVRRQARLVAQWMSVGFVHGVLNTDNIALSGEGLDYGPCAFLDGYHLLRVFSSIDAQGRYAYGKQSDILRWNLVRLAEAILPVIDNSSSDAIEQVNSVLESFDATYHEEYRARFAAKLGIWQPNLEDRSLIDELLGLMAKTQEDFTNTFRNLTESAFWSEPHEHPDWEAWRLRWLARLGQQEASLEETRHRMKQINPAVIPRNLLLEEALQEATQGGDLSAFERLLSVVQRPFETPLELRYVATPGGESLAFRTFCGT